MFASKSCAEPSYFAKARQRHWRNDMKCDIVGCEDAPTFQFTQIESRRVASEKHLCDAHAQRFLAEFRESVSVYPGLKQPAGDDVCVDFELVIYHSGPEDNPACIYLHEVGATRRFCMMVDAWAWWALMSQIKQQPSPRPHTHAAWAETIRQLGGTLRAVMLDGPVEVEGSWSAELRIVRETNPVNLNARPRDAIILAVVVGSPILVDEQVLDRFADRGQNASLK